MEDDSGSGGSPLPAAASSGNATPAAAAGLPDHTVADEANEQLLAMEEDVCGVSLFAKEQVLAGIVQPMDTEEGLGAALGDEQQQMDHAALNNPADGPGGEEWEKDMAEAATEQLPPEEAQGEVQAGDQADAAGGVPDGGQGGVTAEVLQAATGQQPCEQHPHHLQQQQQQQEDDHVSRLNALEAELREPDAVMEPGILARCAPAGRRCRCRPLCCCQWLMVMCALAHCIFCAFWAAALRLAAAIAPAHPSPAP